MGWPKIPDFNLDFGSDDTEEVMVKHIHEVDSLKRVIQMYSDENAQLGLKLNELNEEVYTLQSTIRRRENTIANLKKETNERVSTVTKFNTSDIYKFLSDRYEDSTSVK
jgi:uncharacterized coiled-coil DUF342 family protein